MIARWWSKRNILRGTEIDGRMAGARQLESSGDSVQELEILSKQTLFKDVHNVQIALYASFISSAVCSQSIEMWYFIFIYNIERHNSVPL